ncbi:MAG: hypothetical protein AAFW67_06915 [Cyanobacteria bacterium J06638_38]
MVESLISPVLRGKLVKAPPKLKFGRFAIASTGAKSSAVKTSPKTVKPPF